MYITTSAKLYSIAGIRQFLSAQGTLQSLRSVVLTAFDAVLEKYAEAIGKRKYSCCLMSIIIICNK